MVYVKIIQGLTEVCLYENFTESGNGIKQKKGITEVIPLALQDGLEPTTP